MPKFLHTADWQIGRQFATFDPEHAPLLAEARLAVVERLAHLATTQAVDAVLVAGDVFDAQTLSDRTLRRLFNAMAGYAGPWLLIPGNHDAALAESVWTRAQRLAAVPAHVHLLLAPEVMLLDTLQVAVLPAPLTQRHTYEDLTQWFDSAPSPEGWLRIGLAHGSVQGVLAEGIDSANPIAPDRTERARLDYLALGDWHGCKQINARTWYAGTPEPDRFKANEAGQALLVELDQAGEPPRVTPVKVGQYRWQQLTCAVQVPTDLDALLCELDALGPQDVVDVRVSGQLDLAMQQRLSAALGRAEAQARHLQCDLRHLQLLPTDADLEALQVDGYLADLVAELRAPQANETAQRTAQDALALLTTALAQRAAVPAASGSAA